MTSELPEPWRTQAAKHNLELSYRGLSRATGLGVETVRQAIIGRNRRPSAATVRKLAEALRIEPAELDAWFGGRGSDLEPYEAPSAAARLTPKQRKALDNLILAMVEPEERQRPARNSMQTGSGKTEAEMSGVPGLRLVDPDAYRLAADTNDETPGGDEPGAPDEA